MNYNENGLAVIKVLVENGVIKDETINHVPPMGMSIDDINLNHLESELRSGILDILSERNEKNISDLLFFVEYSKESTQHF